jgi:hypothetical protein
VAWVGAIDDERDFGAPSYGRNQYTWLPETAYNPMHVLAITIDTAHQLAQLYLTDGDTSGALTASCRRRMVVLLLLMRTVRVLGYAGSAAEPT